MTPTILLFGADPMTAAMARSTLTRNGILTIIPDRKEYLRPLESFLPPFGAAKAPVFQGKLEEPLVVLCGFGSLDEVLPLLASVRLGRGTLKAVLTPHNRCWNAVMLLRELQKERRSMGG